MSGTQSMTKPTAAQGAAVADAGRRRSSGRISVTGITCWSLSLSFNLRVRAMP